MKRLLKPYFERQLVEDKRKDGYWIEAFQVTDERPDLIGYGLGLGEVTQYKNPTWKKTLLATYPGPVGMNHETSTATASLISSFVTSTVKRWSCAIPREARSTG